MDTLLRNPTSVLSKQLKYKSFGQSDKTRKPLSPRMRARAGVLRKALIIGFDWVNMRASTGGVPIREALRAEKFISTHFPYCEIRVMYDKQFNLYDPSTSNGVSVAAVLANMEWLGSDLRPGENVILYYAGHSGGQSDDEEFPLHPYYYSDIEKYYAAFLKDGDPAINTSIPPNPIIQDEQIMPAEAGLTQIRRKDYVMAIPELYWKDTQYVYDTTTGELKETNKYLWGWWELKPSSLYLIRDDKIRQLIVDKIPAGSKCLIYLGGCYSRGGGDVPYDWDLMERDTNGNIVQIDKNRIGAVDKCAIGMNYDLTNATHSTTNGQVIVFSSTQYTEFSGAYTDEDGSFFANAFLDSWNTEMEKNIIRNRSSKTVINLKRFYHNVRIIMSQAPFFPTSPQISTGTNMGIIASNNKGTTFLEASNEGIIVIDNFTISSIDGGNTLYVNGELINGNKTINDTLVYIENGKTLVIGDYDFDIIKPAEEGQPFILDMPIMFDIGSRLFDTTQ
jgi:hypothetical protein